MKIKSLVITVVVLAILSAAAYYLTRNPPPAVADARVGKPIADQAVFNQLSKIRVLYNGTTVELVHQPDGTWTIPAYYDMPVDFNKLTQLFAFFTQEKVQRLVTSNPDTIKRLGFDGNRITLFDAAGKEAWNIAIGKDSETGGKYLRFGDEPKAFHTTANLIFDADPSNWADTYLVNLKNEDVSRVEVDFPAENMTLVATRAKPTDPWVAQNAPAGRKLGENAITRILGADGVIRYQENLDLTDARVAEPRPEARNVKFTTFGGRTVEIHLARKPAEKVMKAPAPAGPEKAGPAAALGNITSEPKEPEGPASALASEEKPPGPLFITVKDSDPKSRVNALMQKRAFVVQDYVMTSLPQKLDEALEPGAAGK